MHVPSMYSPVCVDADAYIDLTLYELEFQPSRYTTVRSGNQLGLCFCAIYEPAQSQYCGKCRCSSYVYCKVTGGTACGLTHLQKRRANGSCKSSVKSIGRRLRQIKIIILGAAQNSAHHFAHGDYSC